MSDRPTAPRTYPPRALPDDAPPGMVVQLAPHKEATRLPYGWEITTYGLAGNARVPMTSIYCPDPTPRVH